MSSWRPNWKDATAYPADLTQTQWRWEFLRRCEDYQADFEHYRSVMLKEAPLPHTPPHVWQGFYERCADMPGCREKYGVGFLLDPASDTPPPGFFEIQCPYGVIHEDRATAKARQKAGIFKMAFDLNRPLEPQLKKAKQDLQRIQKEYAGNLRDKDKRAKWPLYLRVLDAKAAQATNRDIAISLELEGGRREDQPNTDRLVSERLKAAREVQDRFRLSAARDVEVRFKETPDEERDRLHKEYMRLRRLFE